MRCVALSPDGLDVLCVTSDCASYAVPLEMLLSQGTRAPLRTREADKAELDQVLGKSEEAGAPAKGAHVDEPKAVHGRLEAWLNLSEGLRMPFEEPLVEEQLRHFLLPHSAEKTWAKETRVGGHQPSSTQGSAQGSAEAEPCCCWWTVGPGRVLACIGRGMQVALFERSPLDLEDRLGFAMGRPPGLERVEARPGLQRTMRTPTLIFEARF